MTAAAAPTIKISVGINSEGAADAVDIEGVLFSHLKKNSSTGHVRHNKLRVPHLIQITQDKLEGYLY